MPEPIKFEGHGHALPPVAPYVPPKSDSVMFEPQVVIDEKTLQPVVKVTERDLDKEIQSYKDDCGIAFVLRQIASGRLSVDQIKDDGRSGLDVAGLPQTMNEASMLQEAVVSAGKAEASKLGIQFTEADLQKLIQAEIVKAAAAKAQQTTNDGGEK